MSTSESIREIALDRITESPNNPRKTFSEAALQELADSIQAQGLIQPIVVREITNSLFRFEIVCGHRRYRAAVRAKLATIPCIVRELTDAQADHTRLHENLVREDVHYIEEAEAMLRLMTEHGVTAAQLMEQTGKKSTYIYGRLKLASLHAKVREACLANTFTAEVATLIARWPLAVQPAAMAACLEPVDFYDAKKGKVSRSYRACKYGLRNMAVPIARADFDPDDSTLPRFDGHTGACTGCPNNTDSDPDLAEHFDVAHCLHSACFEAKSTAAEAQELKMAQAEGRVAPITEARSADDMDTHQWLGRDGGGTVQDLLAEAQRQGLAVPAPKVLVNDAGGIAGRVYDRKAVRELQVQLFPQAAAAVDQTDAVDETDDDGTEWLDGLDADQRAIVYDEGWKRVQSAILTAVRAAPRTVDELRGILLEMLELSDRFDAAAEAAIGWPADLDELDDPHEERQALVRGMNGADLAALLVMDSICERTSQLIGGWMQPDRIKAHIEARMALAHRYGVDVLKASEPTPPPAPTTSEARTSETAAPAAAKGGGVRYRNPSTGESWTGRGLQPKWLKAAIAAGRTLAEFDTMAFGQSSQTTPAGAGGSAAEAVA